MAVGKVLEGRFVNQGTVLWNTTNNIGTSGTTVLRNEGLFQVRDGAVVSAPADFRFENAGLLRKGTGNGGFRLRISVLDTGVVESLAGTIELPSGNWRNDGTLRGTAAYRAGRLLNAGDIDVSLPAGPDRLATLSLVGALTNEASGTISIDLAPLGVSDLLAVSGAVAFDGLLRVSAADGYVPQLGDSFQVVPLASSSGLRDGVIATGFAPGVSFSAVCQPSALLLQVTAVPEASSAVPLALGLVALRTLREGSRLRNGIAA